MVEHSPKILASEEKATTTRVRHGGLGLGLGLGLDTVD